MSDVATSDWVAFLRAHGIRLKHTWEGVGRSVGGEMRPDTFLRICALPGVHGDPQTIERAHMLVRAGEQRLLTYWCTWERAARSEAQRVASHAAREAKAQK